MLYNEVKRPEADTDDECLPQQPERRMPRPSCVPALDLAGTQLGDAEDEEEEEEEEDAEDEEEGDGDAGQPSRQSVKAFVNEVWPTICCTCLIGSDSTPQLL